MIRLRLKYRKRLMGNGMKNFFLEKIEQVKNNSKRKNGRIEQKRRGKKVVWERNRNDIKMGGKCRKERYRK